MSPLRSFETNRHTTLLIVDNKQLGLAARIQFDPSEFAGVSDA